MFPIYNIFTIQFSKTLEYVFSNFRKYNSTAVVFTLYANLVFFLDFKKILWKMLPNSHAIGDVS